MSHFVTKEMSTTLMDCNCGDSTVYCSLNNKHHDVTVNLVHTGQEAEHLGRTTGGREKQLEVQNNSKSKHAHAAAGNERIAVLLVHTRHDAEHPGPVNDNRDHSARRNTRRTSPAFATAGVDDERRMLSFWSIPSKKSSSMDLPTQEGSTTREENQPGACHRRCRRRARQREGQEEV